MQRLNAQALLALPYEEMVEVIRRWTRKNMADTQNWNFWARDDQAEPPQLVEGAGILRQGTGRFAVLAAAGCDGGNQPGRIVGGCDGQEPAAHGHTDFFRSGQLGHHRQSDWRQAEGDPVWLLALEVAKANFCPTAAAAAVAGVQVR